MYRITEEIESGEPTIFRHTLVAGSTGKGKTHFTKNLLRQFATDKRYPIENHQTGATEHSRLNVVILDPENEYSEMRDDNPDLEHNTELVEKLEREGTPSAASTTSKRSSRKLGTRMPPQLVRVVT